MVDSTCVCRSGEQRLLARVQGWQSSLGPCTGVQRSLPVLAAQSAFQSLWGPEWHIGARGVDCRSGCKRQQRWWLLFPYALGSLPTARLGAEHASAVRLGTGNPSAFGKLPRVCRQPHTPLQCSAACMAVSPCGLVMASQCPELSTALWRCEMATVNTGNR